MPSKKALFFIICLFAFFYIYEDVREDLKKRNNGVKVANLAQRQLTNNDIDVCLRYFIALNYAEAEYHRWGELNEYIGKYFRTLMKMKRAGIDIDFKRRSELKEAYDIELQNKIEEHKGENFSLYDQMFFKIDVVIFVCDFVLGLTLDKTEAEALKRMYLEDELPLRPTLKFLPLEIIDGYDIYSVIDYDSNRSVIYKVKGDYFTFSYDGKMQTSDI